MPKTFVEAKHIAINHILAQTIPASLQQAVCDHAHILPAWLIERLLYQLTDETLYTIAPYIPSKLYRRIPLRCIRYDDLRPLVYERPAKELWGTPEMRRSAPWRTITHYTNWRVARYMYREAKIRGGDALRVVCRMADHLPRRKVNALIRMLMHVGGADLRDNRGVLMDGLVVNNALRVANPRLVVALLERAFTAWSAAGAWFVLKTLFERYLYEGRYHYRVIDYVIRRVAQDDSLTPLRQMVVPCLCMIPDRGRLFWKLSWPSRLWVAKCVSKIAGDPSRFLPLQGARKLASLLARDSVADTLIRSL